MSTSTTPFAETLRRHREDRGMTQEELAEAAGLTARGIGALERGERRSPYPHTVRALASALGLSADEQQSLLMVARRREADGQPAPSMSAFVLPDPATPLFGREPDIAAILRRVRQPETRVVTLTGPGGVGKTRLALRVAKEAGGDFDIVAVVPLAGLATPGNVPPAIARAVGVPDTWQPGSLAGVVAALRGQRALLLLDNFEHLAGAAPVVAELVAACDSLTVLVTSRAALSIRDELQYPVPSLAVPAADGTDSVVDLLAYPSVRLFVERARAVNPAFEIAAADAAAVGEICRRLDGLPLAIELAAARTRVLSPRVLLARLTNHLDVLTGGPSDLPERQRTLRSTIGWSYNLLAERERRAFRELAVFVDGFTLEAAESILDRPRTVPAQPRVTPLPAPAIDLIEALVCQNLILRERGHDGEVRFRMLESVREFGQEQFDASDDADAIRQRHADWCLSLADDGERELRGADQRHWQASLEAEHANLRAALAWLRDRGDVAAAVQLGALISRFWWYQGYYGQGRKELEALLALPGASSVRPWWAAAMTGLAALMHKQGELERAIEVHEAAVAEWRAMDYPPGLVHGLWGLGYTLNSIDPSAAQPLFTECLALARAVGDQWHLGGSLWGLGVSARYLGRPEQAADLLGQSLTVIRQLGNPLGHAGILYALGKVERDLGNPERAAELLGQSLVMFRDHELPWGVIWCFDELAALAQAEGRPERAARLLGATAAMRETVGQSRAPVDEPHYAQTIAAIGDALGPERMAEAWAEGMALRSPATIAYALSELASSPASDRPFRRAQAAGW